MIDPPRSYDVAARDFALMLAAITLNPAGDRVRSTVAEETRHLNAAARPAAPVTR